MRRIGLLGGSFDPIHAGHLQLARDAIDALELDELRFVVAAQPWQKPQVSAPAHRLRMVELALASVPAPWRARMTIERCELERSGPSYTIDTLIALRAALGPEVCLALVMGSDQWRNLPTWHRHDELIRYASIAVAERAGDLPHPSGESAGASPALALPALPPAAPLTAPCGQAVSFRMHPQPAAATRLRAALHSGAAVDDLLPPAVLAYIRANHLYETRT